MEEKKRSMSKYLAAVATLAGALAIIPASREAIRMVAGGVVNWGTVQLPHSYAHEKWRRAETDDFSWLEDEWCYPALQGFRVALKMSGDGLEQQNRMGPDDSGGDWVKADVYISDTGLIRLGYRGAAWGDSFIHLMDSNHGSYYWNLRSAADDGSVTSHSKTQAISCTRCTVGETTINCEAPG